MATGRDASQRAILVFGGGGHGKVVADVCRSAGFRVEAFLDDEEAKDGAVALGIPIVAWARYLRERSRWPGLPVSMAVGGNAARERCQRRVQDAGVELLAVVHAAGIVAPTARLGAGTVVMAGGVVNPDAVLGEGCIVNTGAVVEHDCRLGGFVHLSPNAALGGAVEIGDRTHLGLGAVALPGVRIGRDVVVGAGSVVHRNVPDGITVVGVPARPLRRPA